MARHYLVLALFVGCTGSPRDHDAPLPPYPRVENLTGAEMVRLQFGPGAISTVDDRPWGGKQVLEFPAVLDVERGPVVFEVQGLDLSAIRYTGELGWPPVAADSGAIVDVELLGTADTDLRIYSRLADAGPRWDGQDVPPHERAAHRAYLLQAWIGEDKVAEQHYRVETWGAAAGSQYDKIDLRFRIESGAVYGWVRLRASAAWEQGNREEGVRCPWNPAVNNAAPGTADSVWTGECVGADPSHQTGKAIGAWIPIPPLPWRQGVSGAVRLRISVRNWERVRGPYTVRWDDVIVEGRFPAQLTVVSLSGRIVESGFGRSNLLTPRGETARFSIFAVSGTGAGSGRVSFDYRSPRLTLTSLGAEWVLIDGGTIAFAGPASVDGEAGFRYEVQTESESGGGGRLAVRFWRQGSSRDHPDFLAFGEISGGAIERLARP